MYNLERTCKAQLALMSSGATARTVSRELAEFTANQYDQLTKNRGKSCVADPEWDAYMRLALKKYPDLAQ